MPRPKRKQINLTNESSLSLMQEIYNECVEQRSTAIRIQNKMIGFMKEAGDMALIGPVLKEQQKIIDSAIDKKLQLSKLMATIMSKNNEGKNITSVLDGDVRETLTELLSDIGKDTKNDGDNSLEYNM
ncbi:hypothetical protein N9322_01370 [bacterium]|jgi:hypothetical protein|nr:hypothetical protein [bacterium]|tara:strand:+ start:614 stop:997 length:384 start_codon:yes stop_codon:yes gene_type:complete